MNLKDEVTSLKEALEKMKARARNWSDDPVVVGSKRKIAGGGKSREREKKMK